MSLELELSDILRELTVDELEQSVAATARAVIALAGPAWRPTSRARDTTLIDPRHPIELTAQRARHQYLE